MAQLFPPNANAFAKWSIIGGLILVVLLVWVMAAYARIANDRVGVPVEQPVAFSHRLHAGELGLSCLYCHTSVDTAAFAGIPSTETCMSCHTQIRVGDPRLAVVQASWDTDTRIAWNRVHDLADHVFFDHSAHINSGIGCSECHGPVHQMDGMWKNEPLTMAWCLDCHRAPELYIRPREEVFNMDWQRPADQLAFGHSLVKAYDINRDLLMQCSTCHQ
ncbi:MAG: cytochrome c3 family protein [Truepera sp.]|nr:cytochrome c3 family protein [Truepera sp.]